MISEAQCFSYWSCSQACLWRKGKTSGCVQQLHDICLDCDGDAVLLLVVQKGEACHTSRRSCFYNAIKGDELTVLVLNNKVDLISEAQKEKLVAILRSLNPRARIVVSQFGQVPLGNILNTGLFDFEQAAQAPGWLKELRGEHTPETEEYGITSFVFRARRPFHPTRFWQVMDGVVRSKGYFWLASRPEFAGSWSQAGGIARQGLGGMWWASVPKERWPEDAESLKFIMSNWIDGIGDARQELVFIGMDMNESKLRNRLDSALLTDAEMAEGPQNWRHYPDPVEPWFEE